MKNSYKLALITTAFLILTACGGKDAVSTESNSNSPSRVAADTASNRIPAIENTAPPTVNPQVDANALAERKSLNRVMPDSGASDVNTNVPVIPVEPNGRTKAPSLQLGDGSEITTVLGSKGAVETRTFKNNPQLAKLERTTNGKDVSVKVHLKNGKVVTIDKEKIQNFTNDSPEQILLAAGIKPAPPAPGSEPKEKTYTFTFPVKPTN